MNFLGEKKETERERWKIKRGKKKKSQRGTTSQ